MHVSILVPTVLPDYPMWAYPDRHILDYVPEMVATQDHGLEIEIVVVDALYRWRSNYFDDATYPFPVRHVPPDPGWVLDTRRTNHALLRNTALRHATGELIFLVDDTLSFDRPDLLQRVWEEYEFHGNAVSPLVKWVCGDEEVAEDGTADARWHFLAKSGLTRWSNLTDETSWKVPICFGIISYPRAAAIQIGGYDELYDAGDQHLDTTFGMRLAKQAEVPTIIDVAYSCRHEAHCLPDPRVVNSYDPKTHRSSTFVHATHCNYALTRFDQETSFRRFSNTLDAETEAVLEHCPWFEDGKCVGGTPATCTVPHLAVGQHFAKHKKNLRKVVLK